MTVQPGFDWSVQNPILGNLMRHWTQPEQVSEIRIPLRSRRSKRALREYAALVHEALGYLEESSINNVSQALLLAEEGFTVRQRRGRHVGTALALGKWHLLGLAHAFYAAVLEHEEALRGREHEGWDPYAQQWALTRDLVARNHRGVVSVLCTTFPTPPSSSRTEARYVLGLAQESVLQDVSEYMFVHFLQESSMRRHADADVGAGRWCIWNVLRGFILGCDVVAHHVQAHRGQPSPD